MESRILSLYLAGHIGKLQFVKYIKHKKNIGLKEASEYVEGLTVALEKNKTPWPEQPDKLDFPFAYVGSEADRLAWVEETDTLILNFIQRHAESKNHFNPN